MRYLNHAIGYIYTAECLCVLTPRNTWWGWPDLLAVGLASFGDLAREQQVWGTESGALDADLPKRVKQLVVLKKQDREPKQLSYYKAHCQGEVGLCFFS